MPFASRGLVSGWNALRAGTGMCRSAVIVRQFHLLSGREPHGIVAGTHKPTQKNKEEAFEA